MATSTRSESQTRAGSAESLRHAATCVIDIAFHCVDSQAPITKESCQIYKYIYYISEKGSCCMRLSVLSRTWWWTQLRTATNCYLIHWHTVYVQRLLQAPHCHGSKQNRGKTHGKPNKDPPEDHENRPDTARSHTDLPIKVFFSSVHCSQVGGHRYWFCLLLGWRPSRCTKRRGTGSPSRSHAT